MENFTIERFFAEQLTKWPLAQRNFEALKVVETKQLSIDGVDFSVMYNPAREVSSAAKIDAKSIAQRPCFLCGGNRPKEQDAYPILPGFSLLLNPFPIFDRHFTIASDTHEPQSILDRTAIGQNPVDVMFQLAQMMPGYYIFYNGAKCGASAPDHLHFQAVPKANLPLLESPESLPYLTQSYTNGSANSLSTMLEMAAKDCDNGQMINLFMTSEGPMVRTIVIPRRAHRPQCYGNECGQMLISPGAIDVGGCIICCRKQDYDAIDAQSLRQILQETTYFNQL